jgi:hypothetical protein
MSNRIRSTFSAFCTTVFLAGACSAGTSSSPSGGGGSGGSAGDTGGGGEAAGGAMEGAGAGGSAVEATGGKKATGGTNATGGTTATTMTGGTTGTVAGGGSGGTSTGGTGGTPQGTKIAFACTQFLGPNVTGEWFAAGFEKVVDGSKYEVKAPHHSFVEDWANPNHDVWRESACQGTYGGCETKSRCSGNAARDRIVFVTQTGDYLGTPQAKWESEIDRAISTIKAKYPGLKRIELMTFVRSPDGQNCGNETTISPNLDKAHQALAARSNGLLTVAPAFRVPNCAAFAGVPHLSDAGNKTMGDIIGKHYAAP